MFMILNWFYRNLSPIIFNQHHSARANSATHTKRGNKKRSSSRLLSVTSYQYLSCLVSEQWLDARNQSIVALNRELAEL